MAPDYRCLTCDDFTGDRWRDGVCQQQLAHANDPKFSHIYRDAHGEIIRATVVRSWDQSCKRYVPKQVDAASSSAVHE